MTAPEEGFLSCYVHLLPVLEQKVIFFWGFNRRIKRTELDKGGICFEYLFVVLQSNLILSDFVRGSI